MRVCEQRGRGRLAAIARVAISVARRGFSARGKIVAAAAAMGLTACASTSVSPGDSYFDQQLSRQYLVPPPSTGAIFQVGYDTAFFEDIKARRVGDTITVLLSEQTAAEKSSSTSLDRTASTTLTNPGLLGQTPSFGGSGYNFGVDLDSQHDFSGAGSSNQSNRLTGSITVTVAQVLPNGNLVIEGEKWIEINQGEEFIRLKGLIRGVDISATNTVLSTQVADARISYSGRGQMADTNRMGWLSRFFLGALWPF